MKKRIALLLAVVLAVSVSVPALAAEAQYENTRLLIRELDELGTEYRVLGIDTSDDNEDEMLLIDDAFTILCYFSKDDSFIYIRVNDLIRYDPAELNALLPELNRLNATYLFSNWYADESDNTVNVKMDMVVGEGGDNGKIALNALMQLVGMIFNGYPAIEAFAK